MCVPKKGNQQQPAGAAQERRQEGAVYEKGGLVLHMLRHVIGDQDFTDLMRQWAIQHAYGAATTQEFQALAESVTGTQHDWFFDQWVYKAGYPEYSYGWSYSSGIYL